ncbi:MAG: radical SAM protein [Ruminococcus sp.]|nr:radical SAM protein [Ruminococcus sp.]
MTDQYISCHLCPRKCNVNRYETTGYCGMSAEIKAARASLHQWEEPCISFRNGAGTIFFSGCSLRCVYCQNSEISNNGFGKPINAEKLGEIFLQLRDRGADNIELVTPTHFIPHIISALDRVKAKLNIPIVYNCGGYELTETIKHLEGYIDVYLPDIKYFSPDISRKYSSAPDYFEHASKAVKEMIRQVGRLQYNGNGGLIKGTVIRHLVLPNCRHDSMKIMDWIAENTASDNRLVSIMSQYTPFDFIPQNYPELKRRITKMEYNSVVRYAENLGIKGFTQDITSAREEYLPLFNLEGII